MRQAGLSKRAKRSHQERLRTSGLRLAFLIPLMPWPAFHLIVVQGTIPAGRHSMDALAPALGFALPIWLVVHLVGFILMFRNCRLETEWAAPAWTLFALVNAFAMWMYIFNHTAHYV